MKSLKELLKERILVLDGAMGTNLQESGYFEVPEKAVLEAEDLVYKIHRSFVEAGSDAVETCTFGANRVKLKKFGLADKVEEINLKAAAIARKASGGRFVFGSIGPSGLIPEPIGAVSFDFLYDVFKEQALALKKGGVDAILIETFIDVQEARIAALASKEATGLPVFVTLTFNSDLTTDVSATTPEAAVGILEPLGVEGVGANCSLGPEQFGEIVERMGRVAERNTIFQPNAGIPKLADGRTVFDAKPEDYYNFALHAVEFGAGIIGGCCGSKPEHIAALKEVASGKKPQALKKRSYFFLCTPQKFFKFDLNQEDFLIIGERINPTNRKDLQEDLKTGNFEAILKEARLQEEAGAHVLDVNVSVALLDQKKLLAETVKRLCYSTSLPLSIDTDDAEALQNALKVYPGRPLINSISAKSKSLEEFLPVAKRFGAPFIAIAVSDTGIAKTADKKLEALKNILENAEKLGLTQYEILFDPVVLTASTSSVRETLAAVSQLRKEGKFTVFGLSNVSYGLPERKIYNRAFAVLASSEGLAGAIVDPLDVELLKLVKASRFLVRLTTSLLSDEPTSLYKKEELEKKAEESPEKKLYQSIVNGNKDVAESMARKVLQFKQPYDIVSEIISPAMDEVGSLFGEKKIYLPQVLRSAEAVKAAFEVVKPEFLKKGKAVHKAKVVLATVEGDVHDIGKSIVKVILEANGYEVVDLGVDVPSGTIVEQVRRLNPQVVGLSCLMTTTLPALEKSVKILKESFNGLLVAIGGAVVTEEVKNAFGADIYSKDAIGFAKKLNDMFGD